MKNYFLNSISSFIFTLFAPLMLTLNYIIFVG